MAKRMNDTQQLSADRIVKEMEQIINVLNFSKD